MSCPVDCGFIDRITTGPAEADAEVFTYASPLAATSISTTCPSAAPETADDAADDKPGGTLDAIDAWDDALLPEDEPQPAATATTADTETATLHARVKHTPRPYPSTPSPNPVDTHFGGERTCSQPGLKAGIAYILRRTWPRGSADDRGAGSGHPLTHSSSPTP
jgi:hypothetical protein